jgi:hypothetical protein
LNRVGDRLFLEARRDQPGAGAADGAAVGKSDVAGRAAPVLGHGPQRDHALALLVEGSKRGSGAFGSDEEDVEVFARLDEAEMHGKAVAEAKRGAFAQVRRDLSIKVAEDLVGREQHDDIGRGRSLRWRRGPQPGIPDLGPARRAFAQSDDHVDAAVLEVERLRPALIAEAQDRHALADKRGGVDCLFADQLHGRGG